MRQRRRRQQQCHFIWIGMFLFHFHLLIDSSNELSFFRGIFFWFIRGVLLLSTGAAVVFRHCRMASASHFEIQISLPEYYVADAVAVELLLYFVRFLRRGNNLLYNAESWTDNMLRTIKFIEKSHIRRNECKIPAKWLSHRRTKCFVPESTPPSSTTTNIDNAKRVFLRPKTAKRKRRKGKKLAKRQINWKARRDWMRVKRESSTNTTKKRYIKVYKIHFVRCARALFHLAHWPIIGACVCDVRWRRWWSAANLSRHQI